MTRPAPRKSTLSGASVVKPPEVTPASTPAPPTATTARASTPPAPRVAASGERPKKRRQQESYYTQEEDQDGRIRAAFFAGRDTYGWRNMSDMQLETMMNRVEALEDEFNGGRPFEGMPPGTGPVGKPLER
ncbi:ParB family protein [Pseudoclavibacter helvolus]|uniref:ParB family protein n=1 Tax=Pseudoclavibacter helvolus TaxID=255205 RepID=UPI003C73FB00